MCFISRSKYWDEAIGEGQLGQLRYPLTPSKLGRTSSRNCMGIAGIHLWSGIRTSPILSPTGNMG